MKSLKSLIDCLKNKTFINYFDQDIESVAYDSRKCGQNTLFVAIEGSNFDGHDFIDSVIEKGTTAIICEKLPRAAELDANPTAGKYSRVTFIIVPSSREALAEVSHAWFDYPAKSMKFIGVTGTNGKTTTTFLISHILESLGLNTAILGTTGIYFAGKKKEATHTTPESYELCQLFLELKKEAVEYVIMEVSSHSLEQKRVHGIDFDLAIFTNLTHEHLDYHKTIENYAAAKKLLFYNLKPTSTAIVNGDDAFSDYMLNGTPAEIKITVGRQKDNIFQIIEEKITLEGNYFALQFEDKDYKFETKLLGKFNVDNAAMAAAAGFALGVSLEASAKSLEEANGAEGRMTAVYLETGAIGIIDYSHTPDALEKALKTCREILISNKHKDSKLICVFGCGGDRDKTKRPIMGNISSRFADLTIVTDDNPRTEPREEIRKDILAGIEPELLDCVLEIPDRGKAIQKAGSLAKENDIILVAGKGHEKYQILGTEKTRFDDYEVLANVK